MARWQVYAKAGDHHWDAKITIHGSSDRKPPRALAVEGESGARLWGRWSVSRFSQGTIRGVMLAYETEGVAWPCVINRGEPWLFDHCQVAARAPCQPHPSLPPSLSLPPPARRIALSVARSRFDFFLESRS